MDCRKRSTVEIALGALKKSSFDGFDSKYATVFAFCVLSLMKGSKKLMDKEKTLVDAEIKDGCLLRMVVRLMNVFFSIHVFFSRLFWSHNLSQPMATMRLNFKVMFLLVSATLQSNFFS